MVTTYAYVQFLTPGEHKHVKVKQVTSGPYAGMDAALEFKVQWVG